MALRSQVPCPYFHVTCWGWTSAMSVPSRLYIVLGACILYATVLLYLLVNVPCRVDQFVVRVIHQAPVACHVHRLCVSLVPVYS